MAHHEDSHDHGHDTTEGNRQYYPKGWFLPLVGLVVIALCFALGAGALLGISGTDKWGKVEYCTDHNCEGHCGMEHKKECCADGTCDKCKEHKGSDAHHDAVKAPEGGHNTDSLSIAAPAGDSVKGDSAKPAEAGHEGHSH